jgi:hypothetical protein
LRPEVFERVLRNAFYRPDCSHRHEDGSLDFLMRGEEPACAAHA